MEEKTNVVSQVYHTSAFYRERVFKYSLVRQGDSFGFAKGWVNVGDEASIVEQLTESLLLNFLICEMLEQMSIITIVLDPGEGDRKPLKLVHNFEDQLVASKLAASLFSIGDDASRLYGEDFEKFFGRVVGNINYFVGLKPEDEEKAKEIQDIVAEFTRVYVDCKGSVFPGATFLFGRMYQLGDTKNILTLDFTKAKEAGEDVVIFYPTPDVSRIELPEAPEELK